MKPVYLINYNNDTNSYTLLLFNELINNLFLGFNAFDFLNLQESALSSLLYIYETVVFFLFHFY